MKYICVAEKLPNNVLIIRNGDDEISVGDEFGYARITKIEAYGKEFNSIGPGMTAGVTFDKEPGPICVSHEHDGKWARPNLTTEEIKKIIELLGPDANENLIYRLNVAKDFI